MDDLDGDPDGSNRASINTKLCWKCRALLDSKYPNCVTYSEKEWNVDEGKAFSRSLETSESLEKTGQEGCPLCQRLLQAMEAPMRDALHRSRGRHLVYEHSIHLRMGHPGNLSMIVLSGQTAEELALGDEIKCFLDLIPGSEIITFLNHGTVGNSTDSDPTWALVSRWIAQCNSTHKRCAAAIKKPTTLPSRLINVAPGEPLRLIVTNDLTSAAPYATLSHCWGSHMPLRLLSSNIDTMRKEIAFNSLTKTFQDAIYTSRQLSINYLWIDSLCIIQDSKQDWQEQSACMNQVYSHSYCNISAAHAIDGNFGCFTTREPTSIIPLKLDLQWGPDPGLKYPVQSRYWSSRTIFEAPLHLRAWVFQERTLAPRNLILGATEVLFECCEGRFSEHFPSGLPPPVSASNNRGIQPDISGPRLRKAFGLQNDEALNAFTLWSELVKTFSRGHLTYASDKLVALSAVASEMQRHTKSEYLAGMWRQHLSYQLLWEVRGVQWLVRRGRPAEYIAPSWSWASVIGQIETACEVRFADDREIVLEIIEAHVELVSPVNTFGQVKSGYLRVKGHLGMAKVFTRISKAGGSSSIRLSVNDEPISTVIWDDEDDMVAKGDGQELFFLPIQYTSLWEEVVRNGVSMGVPRVAGIVLRQTSLIEQQYVRVGKFEDFGNPGKLQRACRQLAAEEEDNGPKDEGWGLKYTLTIF